MALLQADLRNSVKKAKKQLQGIEETGNVESPESWNFNAEKFGNEDAVAELNHLLKHLKERDFTKATEDYISLKLQELERVAGTDKDKEEELTAVRNDI